MTNNTEKSLENIFSIMSTGDTSAVPANNKFRTVEDTLTALENLIHATKTTWGLLSLGSMIMVTFDGNNGAGGCTAAGLAVGDLVVSVAGLTSGALGTASSSFEGTITVVDEIQQSSASDLSLNDYIALVYRPA